MTREPARTLADRLGPTTILRPSDAGFSAAVRLWNGAVDARPAAVVRPRSEAEVVASVLAARESGLALSVRGGGHDWAGRALVDGGLVIDLGEMREVAVDGAVARVGGGARSGDVLDAAAPLGLTAAIGSVEAVGMAGLTLGGGYGPLCGAVGLAADNLLGARVVLADGAVVDTDDDPDLLWALRGGGGNFGVVTELRVRLHARSRLVGGMVLFPGGQARAVLDRYVEWIADAPDDLTVQAGFVTGPDGKPGVFVAPVWSGDPARGAAVVEPVLGWATPSAGGVGPISHRELAGGFAGFVVDGMHQDIRTRTLATLPVAPRDLLVAAADAAPGPGCLVSLHHCHGVAARTSETDGAFGPRCDHLMVEVVAGRAPDDDHERHLAWLQETDRALAPHAVSGGYPNLLGRADSARAEQAYGSGAARLLALERRYDPTGTFSATPLPAGPS